MRTKCMCVYVYITRVCSDCICVFMILILILMMYITLRARIASRMVMGSRYRGGIVNIQIGCYRARIVKYNYPMALWRFRVRTSNNPSGHSWQHTDTYLRETYHICAQSGI